MKVGDYIHFRYSNYLNYGLTVDQKQTFSPEQILSTQRNEIKKQLNYRGKKNKNKIKKDLENQINFFFGFSQGKLSNQYTPEEVKQIETFLEDLIKQTVKKIRPNVDILDINHQTLKAAKGGGSISLGENDVETWAKIRKAATFKDSQSRTTVQALRRRIEQLVVQANNLRENFSGGTVDQAFINGVDKLMEDYEGLIKEIEQAEVSETFITKSGKEIKAEGIFGQRWDIDTKEKKDFVKAIQDLIDMTRNISNLELQGALGEVVPVVSQWAWEQFQNKSFSEISSLIDTLEMDSVIDVLHGRVSKGQEKTKKVSLSTKVITNKNAEKTEQVKIGDVKLNTTFTQDKVDIVLNFSNSKINASVKNVNLKSGYNIGVLSGTNLINYIQDYPDFANHYLNITANIQRDSSDQAPEGLIKKAHDALCLTVALHAISGGLWAQHKDGRVTKTDKAEIFVVNDVSQPKGRFKVYFISDLIEKISKNINYFKIDEFEQPKTYINKWTGPEDKNMDDSWRRIVNILMQLRTQKLTASISPSILT